MGWSRDLGIVETAGVETKATECTTVEVVDHAAKQFRRDNQLGELEATALPDAVALAKLGVDRFGGKAHVWIGGAVSVNPDGSTTKSVSTTVTITTPKP